MLSLKSRWKIAMAGSVALASISAGASTFTWSGAGGNVNFTTGNNWSGTAPSSSTATDLVFAGSTNVGTSVTPLNQNVGNPMSFHSLNFLSGGGAFFIGGNGFFVDAPTSIVQSSSSNESIANTFTKSGGGNNTQNLTLDGAGAGIVTLSGSITDGTGQRKIALVKQGTSTYVLSGSASNFSGGATITDGTLRLASAGALGASAASMSGGTLDLATNTSVNAFNLTLTGTSTISSDRASTGAGITHTLGTLAIGANQLNIIAGASVTSGVATVTFGNVTMSGNATFDVRDNANLSLGVLTNNFGLTKQGNGTLTLTSASSRTVGTTINGGTVILSNATGLGTGSVMINSAVLNISGVTNSTAGLTLSNGTVNTTGGTLSLGGNIVSTGTSLISAPIALTGARNIDVTNTLTISNRISGAAFGINKQGAGELMLSGANTYAGLTDIQNGKLTVKNTGNIVGSIHVSSGTTFDVTDFGTGFTVGAGKTLSGKGTVSGQANINTAAIVSPGDSGAGVFTLGATDFGNTGHYLWEVNDATDTTDSQAGISFDKIHVTGVLNVSALPASRFNIDITSPNAGTTDIANFNKIHNYDWVIATADGGITNFDVNQDQFMLNDFVSNDTTGVNGAPAGAWSILLGNSDHDLILHYSAAPEPGSVTLLAIGIGGWLGRRPTRRRARA